MASIHETLGAGRKGRATLLAADPPRRGVLRRIVLPAALAAVLLGFALIVWLAWRDSFPAGGEPPLIRAAAGPIKRPPDTPGGIDIENERAGVASLIEGPPPAPRVERLLPREPAPPRTLAEADPALVAPPAAAQGAEPPAAGGEPAPASRPGAATAAAASPPSPAAEPARPLAQPGLGAAAAAAPLPPPLASPPRPAAAGGEPARPGQAPPAPPGEPVRAMPLPPAGAPTAATAEAPVAPPAAAPVAPAQPTTATAAAPVAPPRAAPAGPALAALPPAAQPPAAQPPAGPSPTPPRAAAEPAAPVAARPVPAAPPPAPPSAVAPSAVPPSVAPPRVAPTGPAGGRPEQLAAREPAAGRGPWGVQIAAVSSREAAERGWAQLQGRHPEVLGPLQLRVDEARLASGLTLYRLQGLGFADRESAAQACARLKAAGTECFVVGGR